MAHCSKPNFLAKTACRSPGIHIASARGWIYHGAMSIPNLCFGVALQQLSMAITRQALFGQFPRDSAILAERAIRRKPLSPDQTHATVLLAERNRPSIATLDDFVSMHTDCHEGCFLRQEPGDLQTAPPLHGRRAPSSTHLGIPTGLSKEWQLSCAPLFPAETFEPQSCAEQKAFDSIEKRQQFVGYTPVPSANLPKNSPAILSGKHPITCRSLKWMCRESGRQQGPRLYSRP